MIAWLAMACILFLAHFSGKHVRHHDPQSHKFSGPGATSQRGLRSRIFVRLQRNGICKMLQNGKTEAFLMQALDGHSGMLCSEADVLMNTKMD